MENILAGHSIFADPAHMEAIPVNLLSIEDGRTLLAVTAPLTLIGQGETAQSLVDIKNINGNLILHSPIFQISVEDLVGTSEVQEQAQIVETDSDNVDGTKAQSRISLKSKEEDDRDCQSFSKNSASEKDGIPDAKKKVTGSPTKTGNIGRPRKSLAVVPLQVICSSCTNCYLGADCFKCDICHQDFTKQTLYRRHMETHAEEKPHRCPKCSASFNVPANFTLHMATHNTGEPKCPECGRKFSRMASLKSHMSLHEKEENLFCTECQNTFPTKAQLDAHLKLHGEKWASEEVRKCKLCNKQFGQPALYRLHIREHYKLQTKIAKQTKTGTKHKTLYKCTICLKSFQKPSQLMRHIRVHTGEKPFKCTMCGRAFTQKSSLQIHSSQHNGIRPHACELCNAKFSQKGNLNAHVMRVHSIPDGEPIYSCTYCSCVFKKLGSLNGHMKRMHTEVNGESSTADADSSDGAKTDIRATVNNVIAQLASLESGENEPVKPVNFHSTTLSQSETKNDILQQALKNSGLPSKNKTAAEGIVEQKKPEVRTNFVTLLDRAPDGDTRKYLTIKQRCIGSVRWYACSFCHKEFKKPSDLIRHLRVHTQEKPFKCAHCCRSFALKSTMLAHGRTHSSAKRYSCDSCDKTFACHGSLIVHSRLHKACTTDSTDVSVDNDKSVSDNATNSSNTDAGATSRSRLQSKCKSKLSREAENLIPQVVLQEPLVISNAGNEICVAQIPSKEKRLSAANADPARPHKCLVCQASFRKISHLKQHHRRHTGERPFKCTKCERRFTSNSVLKSHLHTHEDSRPYDCSICSAKFSTQSSMKRHMVTHSNRRPFMCPYCHKTFKTYVNCRKHTKIHKHELAQMQLDEQRKRDSEETGSKESLKLGTESLTPCNISVNAASTNNCDIKTVGDSSSVAVVTAPSASSAIVTAVPSAYSDSVPLSRIGSVEISFQAQLGGDLSQTFGNVCGTAFETSQILHADEAGSVTLPVYTGDQTLTPESIRQIEETLNQQFFNIGMNLNLGIHHTGQSIVKETSNFANTREQQEPVLSVICENNNSNENDEASGGHVFSTQLDSFDIDHIELQTDSGIDVGLSSSNTNTTGIASILPNSVKAAQQGSNLVTTTDNANSSSSEGPSVQAVVFISHPNFPRKEDALNTLEIEDVDKESSEQQCTFSSILLTENFRGFNTDLLSDPEVAKSPASTASDGRSLLQCHVCSRQGFTAIGLKTHLANHRGTKEYQCADCFSRFCTNGGLNRHSKIHAAKQSLKCSSCDKYFTDKTQLRSHGKVHVNAVWKVVSSETPGVAEDPVLSLKEQSTASGEPSLNDVTVDLDAAVSEKVLLDAVAEKEIMDRMQNVLVDRKERKEYTNKCKYCPKTFRKPSDLIRHIRTHTGERPYKCDYCSKSFAVKCTLDSHTKVHTGKKTFRCHVCNSLFATKGSLKVHMRLHTGSKPFRCHVCDSRFRTSGHRKVHLLKHAREYKDNPKRKQKHLKVAAIAEVAADLEKRERTDERRSTCSTEGTETKYPQVETVDVDTAASCLSSQINFDADGIVSHDGEAIVAVNENNQLVSNLHFLLSNGLVTIQAEESLLSQTTAFIDNAQQRSSPIIPDNEYTTILDATADIEDTDGGKETIRVEEMLKCEPNLLTETISPEQPESKSNVPEAKALSVIGSKPAVKGNSSKECDICGKTFTKPYQVERHKRIHTGERPYKCELCTKSFAQKSTLQMHQKHHTGDRPYACSYCEYSFTQKGNLRTHVKRVHQLNAIDMKRWKRVRQPFLSKVTVQENTIDAAALNLDDISFVEFLKE